MADNNTISVMQQSAFRFIASALLLATTLYALSCSNEAASETTAPKLTASSVNPNGDSELALLMRAMYDDAAQMKKAIENGEQPVSKLDHEKMLTASATEPEKAASDTYKIHAQSYLQTLKALEKADVAEAQVLFKDMVDSCMGCHTALCPGPKMKIKHLY